MNEYDFLKRMFHRLHEMNEISERLKKISQSLTNSTLHRWLLSARLKTI